ncbi:hypothetical protein G6F57_014701 [Rhizopus arrhizus]|nr:hypothetical protein G6F57_014701 [Rhizopus arrhizus]
MSASASCAASSATTHANPGGSRPCGAAATSSIPRPGQHEAPVPVVVVRHQCLFPGVGVRPQPHPGRHLPAGTGSRVRRAGARAGVCPAHRAGRPGRCTTASARAAVATPLWHRADPAGDASRARRAGAGPPAGTRLHRPRSLPADPVAHRRCKRPLAAPAPARRGVDDHLHVHRRLPQHPAAGRGQPVCLGPPAVARPGSAAPACRPHRCRRPAGTGAGVATLADPGHR